MTEAELLAKLEEFRRLPTETEWLEFKEAKGDHDFKQEKIGEYFSALSNEANLKHQPFGWLIFGVKDKPVPRSIVGSHYRKDRASLDSLKQEIAAHTSYGLTFEEIHELNTSEGRVILFQIPAAPKGIPTAWRGHYHGRNGESLAALNLYEIEQIRSQVLGDWSAEICPKATLDDLDPEALAFARQQFRAKNSKLADVIDRWDDMTFLNKAKVCSQGQITRTAIILLGKNESEHHLSPAVAQITWILKDSDGNPRDYEHFHPPFLLNVENVYGKIRNLNYRYMLKDSLFPAEVTKYEPWVIREALHNCIAHQDYRKHGRIHVVENDDSLLLTNLGHFIPESVECAIQQDAPSANYRNRFLADAMVSLNMIDTIGSGIKRMFREQRNRFFPLPDYDLSDPESVKVRIIGKVLDDNYTWVLVSRTDLDLFDVIALDKVQKKRPITDAEFKSLKSQGLVEGRRPNLFVSFKVADATGERAAYIRNRGFHKSHYQKMILDYLARFRTASREDFEQLLLNNLPDVLDEKQKKKFIDNLLQEMRRNGFLQSIGVGRWTQWILPAGSQETDADVP